MPRNGGMADYQSMRNYNFYDTLAGSALTASYFIIIVWLLLG